MLSPSGSRPELNTEIVIGDTDYDNYAVIYYQKLGKITMKLYGGSLSHVTSVSISQPKKVLLLPISYFGKQLCV